MTAQELLALVAIVGVGLGAFLEIRGRRLFYTRNEGEGDHKELQAHATAIQDVATRTELLEAEFTHQREDMVIRMVEPLDKITARLEGITTIQAEHGRLLVQTTEQIRALGMSLKDLRDEVRTQRRA